MINVGVVMKKNKKKGNNFVLMLFQTNSGYYNFKQYRTLFRTASTISVEQFSNSTKSHSTLGGMAVKMGL
jgi:hypothetical protein